MIADLVEQGWPVIAGLLSLDEANTVSDHYEHADFRSHIVMARYGFGRGDYKYFSYPLPGAVATLLVLSGLEPEHRVASPGCGACRSSGLQDTESHCDSTHMVEAPRSGWSVLAHAGSAAQKVPEFVVATALAFGRWDALEAEHRSTPPLDAAVILLQTTY